MRKEGVKVVRTDTRGFFANYISTLNQCLALEQIDLVPVIDFSTGLEEYRDIEHENVNMWFEYFNYYDTDCEIIDEWDWKDRFSKYKKPVKKFNGGGIGEPIETFDYNFYKRIIGKYFSIKSNIISELKELEYKYSIDYDNTVGICYRGTDKDTESPRVPYTSYIPVIDSINRDYPTVRMYVQTDEIEFLKYLEMKYTNVFYIKEFMISSRELNLPVHFLNDVLRGDRRYDISINKKARLHRYTHLRGSIKTGYELGKDCIKMMLMLSKCKYMIKNTSGLTSVSCLHKTDAPFNIFSI